MTLIERLEEILFFLNDGDARAARFQLNSLIEEQIAEIDKIADMIELIEEGDEWKNG